MIRITYIPRRGDKSANVMVIQTVLFEKGFYKERPDGEWGPKTSLAIVEFQMASGLVSDGIIGPRTLSALGITVGPFLLKTSDLKGKKDRFLHHKLRALIEKELFVQGVPPLSFLRKDVPMMVVDVAFAMERLQIREVGGNNRGQEVGWIQSVIGPDTDIGNGDAWCMSTDQCIIAFIEDYLGVESPVLASENCMAVKRAAEKVPGLFVKEAVAGSFYILGYTETTGHTGTVLQVKGDRMKTFEGNTGSGSVNDGNGAFLRDRPASGKIGKGTIHGFVLVYPNNKCQKAG